MNPIESSLNIYQRLTSNSLFLISSHCRLILLLNDWQSDQHFPKHLNTKHNKCIYCFLIVPFERLVFVLFVSISWQRNWLSLKFDNSYCSCSWLAKFLFDYVLGWKPTTLMCSCNIDCRGIVQVTGIYIKYFLVESQQMIRYLKSLTCEIIGAILLDNKQKFIYLFFWEGDWFMFQI